VEEVDRRGLCFGWALAGARSTTARTSGFWSAWFSDSIAAVTACGESELRVAGSDKVRISVRSSCEVSSTEGMVSLGIKARRQAAARWCAVVGW
jgi:hypothetical protein